MGELSARSVRVRAAVLQAAGELLMEGGLTAATIDAINVRSGVSKATIYKHWTNRICVGVDAFTEHMAREVPLPDTGSARGDLTEQLRLVCAFYSSPAGAVYAQLLAYASTCPDAAELLRQRFLADRREAIRVLWARAVDRGEVRAEIDVETAIDLLFGPVIFRLVSGHAPLDATQAEAIADAALSGLLRDTTPSEESQS